MGGGEIAGNFCFYFHIFLKWCVQLFIAHFTVAFESNMCDMQMILYLNLNITDLIQVIYQAAPPQWTKMTGVMWVMIFNLFIYDNVGCVS